MTRRRVAGLLVLLLVTTGGLGVVAAGETGSGSGSDPDAPPGATEDRETFTASVGAIRLAPDGEICARQLEPDVYRVTIRNATLRNATVYHEGEVGQRIHTSRTGVNDTLVTYTNGKNPKVRTLARTDACVTTDQPTRTTVEAYYVVSGSLLGGDVTVTSGVNGSEVPEPGGLTLGDAAPDDPGNATDPGDPGNRSTPAPDPVPELTRTPAPQPDRTPTPPDGPTLTPAPDPAPTVSPAPDPVPTPPSGPISTPVPGSPVTPVPDVTPTPGAIPDPTLTPGPDPVPVPRLTEDRRSVPSFRTDADASNTTRGGGSGA